MRYIFLLDDMGDPASASASSLLFPLRNEKDGKFRNSTSFPNNL